MKLSPRDAGATLARPDPDAAGILIFGDDAMRVALKRQEYLKNLLGPEGEAEMRLSRVSAADLRNDPAALGDALKATGFFPGPRAVFVEDAGDGMAPVFEAALADWQKGDAQIVATARRLTGKSKLRKLFEAHRSALCLGIYDDPPTRAEIEAEMKRAGLANVDSAAMTDIVALSRALDPGDFRQTLEKLALFKMGDDTAVSPEDVAACAPATFEAALDDILNAAADAQSGRIGQLLERLGAQGVAPVGLCIAALRHFRALHLAAIDPGGPASGLAKMRPPIFGPRRDRMTRQAQNWGKHRLEQAISLLVETDMQLRSGRELPQMAMMERVLIRLAMMPGR